MKHDAVGEYVRKQMRLLRQRFKSTYTYVLKMQVKHGRPLHLYYFPINMDKPGDGVWSLCERVQWLTGLQTTSVSQAWR
jgi:hypothetical protein